MNESGDASHESGDLNEVDEEDGQCSSTDPFIIETNAVIPSGSDMVDDPYYRATRLRTLQSLMEGKQPDATGEDFNPRPSPSTASLPRQTNAEANAAAGRAPTDITNVLVVPHTGNMVSDFYDDGLAVGAYFDLFPHGVGGHLDQRQKHVGFNEWARILMRQRDPCCGKSKTFLFCVCAMIFKREAISNARWRLTGRISRRLANSFGTLTANDIAAVASEVEQGVGTLVALSHNSSANALIKTMASVHSGTSWTIYNKRPTRKDCHFSYNANGTTSLVDDLKPFRHKQPHRP